MSEIVMNFSEFLIIYLACGAPFGVHYFLQKRREKDFRTVVLKSFLTVFVWIPYAFKLSHSRITRKLIKKDFAKNSETDAIRLKNLDLLQGRIWQMAVENDSDLSYFEFREVFQRYAGLTLALKETVAELPEAELLTVAVHPDINLGVNCIKRRNRLLLEFHQTLASRDFLKLLAILATDDSEKFRIPVIEFVKILDDAETLRAAEPLLNVSAQTNRQDAVKETENEVWNTSRHKPQPVRAISIPLTSQMRQKNAIFRRD